MISKKNPLSLIIDEIESLQTEINNYRPLSPEKESLIYQRFRIDWTYNSNAIEGNTLTFGETAFFLKEGLTSEGRPLEDYLETKNHAEAIDGLLDIVENKRPMSEGVIKQLHAVLVKGIEKTTAKGADGRPIQKMEKLIQWLKKNKNKHPLELSAIFHYRFVSIHPFDDGNGRLARILMNLILIKHGYPPCVIKNKNRKKYLEILEKADQTQNLKPFILFVGYELLDSLKIILDVIHGRSANSAIESTSLNQMQRFDLILQTLKDNKMSIAQMKERLWQIKRPTLKSDLKKLVLKNKIIKFGNGKSTVYKIK